ncbi:MAG: hypothetical protein ACKO2S_02935, partial [Burkholderiaceae bacterium]
ALVLLLNRRPQFRVDGGDGVLTGKHRGLQWLFRVLRNQVRPAKSGNGNGTAVSTETVASG